MTIAKVQRGDRFKKHLRASTWNAFVDAATANRLRGGERPGPNLGGIGHLVFVQNSSGAAVGRGDILGIDGVAFEPSAGTDEFEHRPILDGATPTSSHHGKFVVVREYIPDGCIGKASIDSLCVVRVDDLTLPWSTADVDTTDATRLAVVPNGTAQILYQVAAGSENIGVGTHSGDTIVTQGGDSLVDQEDASYALVRLGVPQQVSYLGVADGAITYDSSGTVSLWSGGADTGKNVTAHLDWMHGDENVSSGKEVVVTWFPLESKWRITAAECE